MTNRPKSKVHREFLMFIKRAINTLINSCKKLFIKHFSASGSKLCNLGPRCVRYRLDVSGCVQLGLCLALFPGCFPIFRPLSFFCLTLSPSLLHASCGPGWRCLVLILLSPQTLLACPFVVGWAGMGDFGPYVFYLPL